MAANATAVRHSAQSARVRIPASRKMLLSSSRNARTSGPAELASRSGSSVTLVPLRTYATNDATLRTTNELASSRQRYSGGSMRSESPFRIKVTEDKSSQRTGRRNRASALVLATKPRNRTLNSGSNRSAPSPWGGAAMPISTSPLSTRVSTVRLSASRRSS